MKLSKFRIYGKNNPEIEKAIQHKLELRGWGDLSREEKKIALQQLKNDEWINKYSDEILRTIVNINHCFLRECPGKILHCTLPEQDHRSFGGDYGRREAAFNDFQTIFLEKKSEPLVFRMLTKFAEEHIDLTYYRLAEQSKGKAERKKYIEYAFKKFDRLANCLNHIFEQFAVNAVLTRNGLVPKQDDRIIENIYIPALQVLSDPKWKSVNQDLGKMFRDYTNKEYAEVITKAHKVVQRFLQITAGEEGKNGKGEVGKLFNKLKKERIIPIDRFTEPIVEVFKSFISSERATKSTAKPTLKKTTSENALLMMNVVMIFLQHCLTAKSK